MKNGQYKWLPKKQLREMDLCAQTRLRTLWKALNIGLYSHSIFCRKKGTKSLNIFWILPEEEKTPHMFIMPATLPHGDRAFMLCPRSLARASRISQPRIDMTILKRFSLLMARKERY